VAVGRTDDLDVDRAKGLLARGCADMGFSGTIPAIVNSTEGSFGISEADASRRWSRCWKNSMNVRRISSEVIANAVYARLAKSLGGGGSRSSAEPVNTILIPSGSFVDEDFTSVSSAAIRRLAIELARNADFAVS
jgi:hypothetical protein